MNNKLKLESKDLTQHNIEQIAQLFPQVVTEVEENSTVKKAIDFEKLKLVLSAGSGDYVVADDERERYEFTWVGKRQAMIDAATPIRKTLRPCPEESKNWETTENLYIEGDNLEVLKLLQESYLNKVKMIYIDPPYNTGKDFVYKDNFKQDAEEYNEESGMYDEDDNKLFQNTETNGRFHSDWCSMIYPRLQLSRNLLTDDGVIFISIDDNEVENLKKICDEVFGASNFVSNISRVMKSGSAQGDYFSPNVEYILVFARNITTLEKFKQPISEEIIKKLYTSVEKEGVRKNQKYRPFGLYQSSLDPLRGCSNQRYYIEAPDGTLLIPPGNAFPPEKVNGAMISPKTSDDKVWRWSQSRYFEELAKGNIEFKKSDGVLLDSNGLPAKWNVYTKIWLSDRQEEGMTPVDLITKWENRLSKKELKDLHIPFDFAKPSELVKFLMSIVDNNTNSTIVDFFSGSATTAHAVMQLNAEDGGNRKFICVQLPEKTDEKSEAYKAGYANICEIGKERIRRAGDKILGIELGTNSIGTAIRNGEGLNPLDTGFRVFKTDTTNMKDVYYAAGDFSQASLFDMQSNIKDDRSDIDLLYGALIDWGIELSYPHTTEEIEGQRVHTVDTPLTDEIDLIACFDTEVSETVIREIASRKPLRALFRDHSFTNSANKINVYEIFKAISPDTTVKVV